jgi:guanine nucleotide-binding protein G(i) subunit alpha
LNNTDLFAEKLARSPLRNYFPDYDGADNETDAACNYFRRRFISQHKPSWTNSSSQICAYYTNARNAETTKSPCTSFIDIMHRMLTRVYTVVLSAIQDNILQSKHRLRAVCDVG